MRKLVLIILLSLSVSGCVGFVAGAALGGVVGGVVSNDRRSLKTMEQDQTIAYESNCRLLKAKELKDVRVIATAYNHAVLLVGEVSCEEQKQLAEDLIRGVKNVRRIYNEITIACPISYVTQSEDAWITTKLHSKMVANKCLYASPVKILTENGVVYLMGIVTHDQADTAVDIACQTAGVTRVVRLFDYVPCACTCGE